MKALRLLLAAACVAGFSGACSKSHDARDQAMAAIARTESQPRRFIYRDTSSQGTYVVQGAVEDDFRYSARVQLNGAPVLDEVGSDDALAERFVAPAALPLFLAAGATPKGGGVVPAVGLVSTGQSGSSDAFDALQSSRWVVDKIGAPSVVTVGGDPRRALGKDPVIDSLTVLQYVKRSVGEAFAVKLFNKEALDYKAKEDPFPQPKAGSGIKRYDLTAPFLPRSQGGGNQAVPGTNNFRKLSIYVKDGLVIQVLEKIDVEARLKDMARIYGVKYPAGESPAKQAEFAISVINTVRTGQGNDPIRIRTMSVDLRQIGTRVHVVLPSDAVEGNLSFLNGRGKAARTAAASASAGTATATTATTAAATGTSAP